MRPRLAAGLPLSRRRSVSASENDLTCLEALSLSATWPFFQRKQAGLYARELFLTTNFLNTVEAKFVESACADIGQLFRLLWLLIILSRLRSQPR